MRDFELGYLEKKLHLHVKTCKDSKWCPFSCLATVSSICGVLHRASVGFLWDL